MINKYLIIVVRGMTLGI